MVKAFENLQTFVPNWIERYVKCGIIDVLQIVELDDSFLVLTLDKLESEVEFQVFYIGRYANEDDCFPEDPEWTMTYAEFEHEGLTCDEHPTLEDLANIQFFSQLAGFRMGNINIIIGTSVPP